MPKQFTFPYITTATKIYPNGHQEQVKYGQYETIMIVKENGWDINRTITLAIPVYPVTEIECEDGSKLIFNKALYLINQKGYKS